eukprot:5770446-Alexandrium_andersonii.AAC.1
MSASLVGSEMCIRDSLLPPLIIASQTRAPDVRKPRNSGTSHNVTSTRHCLLYTSDAADDM